MNKLITVTEVIDGKNIIVEKSTDRKKRKVKINTKMTTKEINALIVKKQKDN